MSTSEERERLDNVAADSWYLQTGNIDTSRYCARVFRRYIEGGRVLEMGPAEGVMTGYLRTMTESLTLVEGSENFCRNLREQFPDVEVVHSLFEDYEPAGTFETIVLGHVLEHVADPVAILQRVCGWLSSGGRVLAAVPNANSLHRQAAVIMGLLEFEEAMNEADIHHGHRRVFNPATFRQAFNKSGLKIEVFGGYWLKPVSNGQIEESWTPEMLEAFMELGERYPDIAGEIYIVAGAPKEG